MATFTFEFSNSLHLKFTILPTGFGKTVIDSFSSIPNKSSPVLVGVQLKLSGYCAKSLSSLLV